VPDRMKLKTIVALLVITTLLSFCIYAMDGGTIFRARHFWQLF
jgi:hypothetical protein